MLIFGQAHRELDELLTHIRQEIAMGEKILAANKARLVHFEQTFEALLGITDPASVPAPQAVAQVQSVDTANSIGAEGGGVAAAEGAVQAAA